MRAIPTCTLLIAAALLAAPMASAQILGARPGYNNATLKAERQRQQLQTQLRQAERDRAAREAAEQATKK